MNEISGILVDGFTIGSIIGKGSIGTVFNAVDASGRPFAIKIMQTNPFLDESVLDSVVEGALSTSKISDCARIVRVHKAGRTPDFHYIVMDFMQGGTLERILEENDYPIHKKLLIGLSLSQTIACVHSKRIIHGDIKPGNVMLDADDMPYLTDFYYSSLKKGRNILPQGTPRYMSPEQAMGLFITTSSDIYSFGVLLYELLTGKLPYKTASGNIAGMIETVSECEIVNPALINSNLDKGVCALLCKLLEKKPENRYHTMEEVALVLEGCVSGKNKTGKGGGSFLKCLKERLFGKSRSGDLRKK